MAIDDTPPRFRFGHQFSLLARQWRRAVETRLEQAGLTDATWAPLVHLSASGGGITQKELAALVGIDGSTLVRLLDILSDKGLSSGARTKRTAAPSGDVSPGPFCVPPFRPSLG